MLAKFADIWLDEAMFEKLVVPPPAITAPSTPASIILAGEPPMKLAESAGLVVISKAC